MTLTTVDIERLCTDGWSYSAAASHLPRSLHAFRKRTPRSSEFGAVIFVSDRPGEPFTVNYLITDWRGDSVTTKFNRTIAAPTLDAAAEAAWEGATRVEKRAEWLKLRDRDLGGPFATFRWHWLKTRHPRSAWLPAVHVPFNYQLLHHDERLTPAKARAILMGPQVNPRYVGRGLAAARDYLAEMLDYTVPPVGADVCRCDR